VLHKICKFNGWYDAAVEGSVYFLNGCCAHSLKGSRLEGKIFLRGNMILYMSRMPLIYFQY
jgi:hypothetical protein